MKISITFAIALCYCTAMTALGKTAEKQQFTLSGVLSGALPGDTLRFVRVEFPGFVHTPGFDVVVGTAGEFKYRGSQPNASLYIMTYLPATGKAPSVDRMGKVLFIRNGDKLKLTGVRNKYAFCAVEGGAYANSMLRRIETLGDSIGWCRSSLLQKRDAALQAGDSVGAHTALDAFNAFRSNGVSSRIDSLQDRYFASPEASELAAVWMLQRSSDMEPAELSAKFAELPAVVRESHHGILLNEQVARALALEPGQPAPDFTLAAADGTIISRNDFQGKYLLIYHWGTCPGSMQADPRVKDLYDKTSRERWAVIGVTSGRSDVERMHINADSTSVFLGMKLKERTGEMLNHPYPDYDLNIGGNDIEDRYMFGGLPFFILISPEGTILARGFHEALQQAVDLAY